MMEAIIFDIHNTICFQKNSIDFFIDTTYRELSTYVDETINYAKYKKYWINLDLEYQDMTKKGFLALTNQDSNSVKAYLREIPHIEKVQVLLSQFGIDSRSGLPEIINDHFQRHWIKGLTLYPYTISVLQDLSPYRLGVVSNFRESKWLYKWIDNQGLSKYFHNDIIISEEIGYRKPDPILFLKILGKMNLIANDSILYVGDNELEDSIGATLVGIRPVIIGRDIGSLQDLPSFLANMS